MAEALLSAEGGAEKLLTEMSNAELLGFVALDLEIGSRRIIRRMSWYSFRCPYVFLADERRRQAKAAAKKLTGEGRVARA